MRVRVKFSNEAGEDERRRVLASLEGAEPLFPGDADPELSSLYVGELADERRLAALKRSPAVEFAEPEAERRLHLPEELKDG
jgi:hypothetical protein